MADLRIHLRPDLRPNLQLERASYVRPHEPVGLARLHMNESAEDWPEQARAEWIELLKTLHLNEYPETEGELARTLERRLGAPEGGVLLGSSSGALLDHITMAGIAPGDRVAFPDPGFSLYPMLVRRHGGVSVKVPVGRAMPLEGFVQAAKDGAKQLWVTVPNNPTGAWISPGEVRLLLESLASIPEPPLVVLDEAYAEFSPRTLRLLVDEFEHVLLLRTFSKALGSAGLRLGAVIGHPSLIAELAAVKLPYSISSPQLAALKVALKHSVAFEQSVHRTEERRDRLRNALVSAGYSVTESASNFLHLDTDVCDTLQCHGLLARRLPPGQGTRISMGSEPVTERVATALNAKLEPPGPLVRRPLLVLDVDGVMIDAEESFREAVRLALQDLRPSLCWDSALFRAMKRLGGMNNDFRLAAGLLAIDDRAELNALLNHAVEWTPDHEQSLLSALDACTERVSHHYASTKTKEHALITLPEIAAISVPFAIFTGRNRAELQDAFSTLGFRCEAACDCAPHMRKPTPSGLLQLADSFRATDVLFVGDTRDDRASMVQAASLREQTRFRFAGVGPDRTSFTQEHDFSSETLRTLFSTLLETFATNTPWFA